MRVSNLTTLLLLGSALPAVALAQAAPSGVAPVRGGDHHADEPETIIVTALRRDRVDVLGGVSVLDGPALDAARRTSIGETLAGLPGVSASSFGPTASRPILRGFQGDRIRVLTDGIGSFDASSSSVDHAVAINPLLAERIEVLRGPSALLYGSSAIGGVVNVIGTRIPRSAPDETVHMGVDADYGSAADERRVAGVADLALGGGLVAHVDGSFAETGDLRTGGFILSRPLRAQARLSDDAEVREDAELRGRLDNSQSRLWEVGGGLAYVDSGGSIGFSASRMESRYGVPNRISLAPHDHDEDHDDHDHGEEDHDHDHGHGHSHEDVTIDLAQTRLDLRGEVTPGAGAFERITLRAGYGDYRHFEIEDDGEVATEFYNKGLEGRLELVQRRVGGWGGASGVQVLTRDYRVIGEEAFLPFTRATQAGLFTVQTFDFGAVRAEGGLRYERSEVEASPSAVLGTPADRRSFDAVSGSVGASLALATGTRLGLNLSHSERAPTAEELFSAGAHAATQSFEIGDRNLARERSNGAELVFRTRSDRFSLEVSGYYNDFGNFIYQTPTGEEIDELPVYAYRQGGAEQWGFEGQVTARLFEVGSGWIETDAIADYVRVTIDDVGPAPFIPPLRVLGGVAYRSGVLDVRAEAEHVTPQRRVAAFETGTDDFTLVNLRADWRPGFFDNRLSFRIAANNIFDVEARRHASQIKDFAPLAGRDIRVGASLNF